MPEMKGSLVCVVSCFCGCVPSHSYSLPVSNVFIFTSYKPIRNEHKHKHDDDYDAIHASFQIVILLSLDISILSRMPKRTQVQAYSLSSAMLLPAVSLCQQTLLVPRSGRHCHGFCQSVEHFPCTSPWLLDVSSSGEFRSL